MESIEYKIEPNKGSVIESAKTKIKDWEVLDNNIGSKALNRKVFKKCQKAVLRSTDFREIGKYLVQSLNNLKYDWAAFVYQKSSADYLISNFVYKIQLSFGELYIVLISHYRKEDFNHNLPINSHSKESDSSDVRHQKNITESSKTDLKEEEEVVPNSDQLATVSVERLLQDHSEARQTRTWEWPLDRILNTIKNSIRSLKQ